MTQNLQIVEEIIVDMNDIIYMQEIIMALTMNNGGYHEHTGNEK